MTDPMQAPPFNEDESGGDVEMTGDNDIPDAAAGHSLEFKQPRGLGDTQSQQN